MGYKMLKNIIDFAAEKDSKPAYIDLHSHFPSKKKNTSQMTFNLRYNLLAGVIDIWNLRDIISAAKLQDI